MYELLDRIDSPSDLRKLSVDQLKQLCCEIREYMVEVCSHNPGHLASSLGAVELIVALHYVYNTPEDKLVFDVGHQAYAHKILTCRKAAFAEMRTQGGIAGFPKMSESPYDAFGAGHSSVSVSAALGYAEAARQQGHKYKTVSIIGDGALTGGLAFEGLNNAGNSKSDILIIVNDNNQSIDSNLGGLHNHLLRITTSHAYNNLKNRVWNFLGERWLRKAIQNLTRSLKHIFVKRSGGDIFEALGLRYFGPVDGHDIESLINVLTKLRTLEGPRVLHCTTVKGKGYAPAEEDPIVWHAPGKFDPRTGQRIKTERPADRYQDVFGQVICDLADSDSRVVGITPAMASGCGMNLLAEKHPDRFYDVGIEEEHAVTFSAGLAAGGLRPFCNIYSTFSQRAFDQIVHDVALQGLPVTLCLDRGGLVGEDGATHQGTLDMAAYRCIPGAIICSPANEIELKNLMYTSLDSKTGPFIIRYPRGCGEGVEWRSSEPSHYIIGKAEELRRGTEVAVVAIGHVVQRALEAASLFGDRVGVYNFRFLKPLDEEMLDSIFNSYRSVLTLEDGALMGGLYSSVCEYAASCGSGVRIFCSGIPDEFVEHARQEAQRRMYGLSTDSIVKKLEEIISGNIVN